MQKKNKKKKKKKHELKMANTFSRGVAVRNSDIFTFSCQKYLSKSVAIEVKSWSDSKST